MITGEAHSEVNVLAFDYRIWLNGLHHRKNPVLINTIKKVNRILQPRGDHARV